MTDPSGRVICYHMVERMMSSRKRQSLDEVGEGVAHFDKKRKLADTNSTLSKKRKRYHSLCEFHQNNQHVSNNSDITFVGSTQGLKGLTNATDLRTFQNRYRPTNLVDLNHDPGLNTCEPFECYNYCPLSETSYKRPRQDPENIMHLNLQPYIPPSGSSVDKDTDLSPEFNSFNYWKPTLPDIDLDMKDLQEEPMEIPSCNISIEQSVENPAFNSFNFWKMPVQDICMEFLSL